MDLQGIFTGLGNPGPKYHNTRHNFGFMLLDSFMEHCQTEKLSGPKDKYELWKCRLPAAHGNKLWLALKPLTYMNLSGEAVVRVLHYYRLTPGQLLVAHDEMDLPLGRMRLKIGGGAAGHKGILSIAELLGVPDFYRLRLGIGKNTPNAINHVLGHFAPEELPTLNSTLTAATQTLLLFATQGFTPARDFANAFKG